MFKFLGKNIVYIIPALGIFTKNWNFLGYYTFCEIINMSFKNLFKRILGDNSEWGQRPTNYPQDILVTGTYGMPSSHSQLITFTFLYFAEWRIINFIILLNTCFYRIRDRYHTLPQIIVGQIIAIAYYLLLKQWELVPEGEGLA